MQIEFAAAVASAMQTLAAQTVAGPPPAQSANWSDVLGLIDKAAGPNSAAADIPVTVLPVPPGVSADVCSPVLFQMANRAHRAVISLVLPAESPPVCGKEFTMKQAAPAVLASSVLPVLEKSCPWFDFHLGGIGHLNASANKRFAEDFRKEILKRGAAALFSPESFFTVPVDRIAGVSNSPERDHPAVRFISEFSGDWSSAIANFTLSKETLRRRSAASTNPDVARIVESLDKDQRWSLDGVVMLLAVLSDPEIDSSVYFRSLAGRENVPWYFKRFFRDSRDYIEGLAGKLRLPVTQNRLDMQPEPTACTDRLAPVWKRLFSFREAIFRAIVAPYLYSSDLSQKSEAASAGDNIPARLEIDFQSERIVNASIELIRGYYSFYNRPEWRIEFGKLDPAGINAAHELSTVLREAVSQAVTMLKNACDNGDFTLQK